MNDEKRHIVDEYLDPWLETYLSAGADGNERREEQEGSADGQHTAGLADRLERVVRCAEIVHRHWGESGAPPRTKTVGELDVAGWTEALPERLGRFEIRRELGQGGGGVVFLAFDPSLQREVALKIPQPQILVSAKVRERFLREARAAGSLDHPNIISVYETGSIGPVLYIASAYCPGPTLHRWLSERAEPVPVDWAVRIMSALAAGVEHAHRRGVWHRDLKPGNVLLEPCGQGPACGTCRGRACEFTPKISDFGLALLIESEPNRAVAEPAGDQTAVQPAWQSDNLTRTGVILGTALYMSPEQAAGRNDLIGPHTDVHALGIMLYELLTRRRPFEKNSHFETLAAVQRDDAVPPSRYRNELPRDLEAICLKCLEKVPARRYASAAQLSDDLRRFARGEPVVARQIGRLERWGRWLRRHPTQAGFAATFLVALVALVSVLAVHNTQLTRLNTRLQSALVESEEAHRLAQRRESEVRELWYAADMQLAHQAWLDGDSRHYRMLLERHRMPAGREDEQGWEWRFLRRIGDVQETELYRGESPLYCVRFSPDARWFGTTGKDSTVRVWNAASGERKLELNTGQGEVNKVAFSPDSRWLATAGDDGTVHVYSLDSGERRNWWQVNDKLVFGVAFSPDGRLLATGGADPVARLWDPASGELLDELTGHEREIEALAFSADGRWLATASSDHTVIIWDVESRQRNKTLVGHQGRLAAVAFSPNGRRLATCALDRHVFVWDLRTGARLFEGTHLDGVQSVTFTPDGAKLASGDRAGGIRIWRMPQQGRPNTLALEAKWQAHDGRVYSLAYGPEGRQLVSAGSDGRLAGWRYRDRLSKQVLGDELSPAQQKVSDLTVVPDSQLIATAHDDAVRLWRASDGRLVKSLSCEHGKWQQVCVSPDGRWLAAGNEPGNIAVWDWNGERLLAQWSLDGVGGSTDSVALSPDKRTLAVIRQFSSTDHLRLYDPLTGQRLPGPPAGMSDAVAFSPTDNVMAADVNHDLVLWRLDERRAAWVNRQVHETTISDIRFSRDGKLIVTASHDRQIKLWNAATGELIRALSGNRAAVKSVVFVPDGRCVLSADEDGAIVLWYLATGQKLFELTRYPEAVRNIELVEPKNWIVLQSSSWRAVTFALDMQ